MASINPAVLKWARETAGLTIEQAARKLSISDSREISAAEKLENIETGVSEPSRSLILRMTKQYRRPLLTFYLKAPPRTAERGEDFRTLPETGVESAGLVDALVRDIKVRQGIVRELLEEEDSKLDFVGSFSPDRRPTELAEKIAKRSDFRLFRYRASRDTGQAFNYLRQQVESTGVFVIIAGDLGSHHSKIPVTQFRGFAIADIVAPFIAINSNDSKGALSFTLIHELAHIWLGQTGVSGGFSSHRIEKYCDQVASELLLPEAELREVRLPEGIELNTLKSEVSKLAAEWKVSSTMVAYRLVESGRIDNSDFQSLRAAFHADFLRSKERDDESNNKNSGPSYYVTSRYRAGGALLSLMDRSLGEGSITSVKAGRALGVSPANLGGVLTSLPPRSSGASA